MSLMPHRTPKNCSKPSSSLAMALIQQHAVAKPTRAMTSAPTGTGSPQSHSGAASAASIRAVGFSVCRVPEGGHDAGVRRQIQRLEIVSDATHNEDCSGRVSHCLMKIDKSTHQEYIRDNVR